MSHNFHKELIAAFDDLEKEFQSSLQDAKTQERDFETKLENFRENIQKHLETTQKNIPPSNPMSAPIANFTKNLAKINNTWQERTKKQDKGVGFRAGFNDSLLVFVFGKVKSGKSSLGNYIAWGNTDPTEELKKKVEHQPKYFSGEKTDFKRGDAHKEAEQKREFRVGATEATSSIQGFSLPGLTWVDSPGLHSINEANGELAKDYVEHSDLVLYTMKSNEPGRRSDIEEIIKLHAQDKKLLILITGSDEMHEDEDENGEEIKELVMKEKHTQQSQQNEVRKSMEEVSELKNHSKDIEILSISARYAQKHPDDAEKFKESGMSTLFETLSNIAKAEGIKLKQKAPLKNLSNYLKGFSDDVEKFEQMIRDFESPIKKIEEDVLRKIPSVAKKIERELDTIISDEFSKLEEYRDDAHKLQDKLKESSGRIQKKRSKLLRNSQEEILTDVLSNLGKDMVQVVEKSEFLQLPAFKIEHTTEKIVDSISSGTRKRNSGIGGLLGAAVGGAIGSVFGGVGALAGASLGGTIGGYFGQLSGDDASPNFREISVKTGDNFYEIKDKLSNNAIADIESQMQSFGKNVVEKALSEVETMTQNIQREVDELKQYLSAQQEQIQTKLNQ